jgi:SAM-dependent methyltransferase
MPPLRTVLLAAWALLGWLPASDDATLDVVYVPTPEDVVEAMLDLARVTPHDVVYDLGCGDGRIVVAAAKRRGCRGVGIDLSPARVREANALADRHNVRHLVEIRQEDLFGTDLSGATVVALYLLPELNRRLVPQLERMRPGSRIVSHVYDGLDELGIVPDATIRVVSREDNTSHLLHLWTVPFRRRGPISVDPPPARLVE